MSAAGIPVPESPLLPARYLHRALPERDGGAMDFPSTEEQLADATGMTPVHTNRTLQSLRRDGLHPAGLGAGCSPSSLGKNARGWRFRGALPASGDIRGSATRTRIKPNYSFTPVGHNPAHQLGPVTMQRMQGWIGRKDRQSVVIDAVVHRADGSATAVKLTDVSEEGCRIEAEMLFAIGERSRSRFPSWRRSRPKYVGRSPAAPAPASSKATPRTALKDRCGICCKIVIHNLL